MRLLDTVTVNGMTFAYPVGDGPSAVIAAVRRELADPVEDLARRQGVDPVVVAEVVHRVFQAKAFDPEPGPLDKLAEIIPPDHLPPRSVVSRLADCIRFDSDGRFHREATEKAVASMMDGK